MIQKALIIACGLLLLAVAAMGLVAHSRGQTIGTLTAEKALVERELYEANADIEVSEANHNRIVAEKDALLSTELTKAKAERDVAVFMAGIKKDIQNAPDSTACIGSAPFGALLDGLYLFEQQQGDGQSRNDRIPGAGQSGEPVAKPRAPKGPTKDRFGSGPR